MFSFYFIKHSVDISWLSVFPYIIIIATANIKYFTMQFHGLTDFPDTPL